MIVFFRNLIYKVVFYIKLIVFCLFFKSLWNHLQRPIRSTVRFATFRPIERSDSLPGHPASAHLNNQQSHIFILFLNFFLLVVFPLCCYIVIIHYILYYIHSFVIYILFSIFLFILLMFVKNFSFKRYE